VFVEVFKQCNVGYSWQATRALLEAREERLASPVGALCFLCSSLFSRRLGRFNAERDDATPPLIDPHFGHCCQEVLNLMILGQGVSNLFDGERDLGGGFLLRGVSSRPPVGLLSEMEALRYLAVGSLYKQPLCPVWVVASQSHFSVLFSLSAAVLRTSHLEALEERLLRAFSEYDSEGNGFISAEHLPSLSASLPEWSTPPLEELRAVLDPEGTSLLVWDTFLQVMRPLHPEFASAMAAQPHKEGLPPKVFSLLHYNGLASAGHAHKRALRHVTVRTGEARGQPMADAGLAAVLQTRWKDASIGWHGTAPSIN